MGAASPNLSAIIVSFNTREMTLRCLETLKADLAGITSDIWLVDNDSKDGTVAAVRDRFPDVNVIENPRNAGFGAANNIAMRRCKGEYLLLLNSDAFPKPGAMAALLRCANAHPKAAVIAPRLLNEDGTLQISCYRFPSPSRAWFENLWISALLPGSSIVGDYRHDRHDTEREVEWVIGACMLVRREAYEQIGGFDEKFFMYQEETDWQKRMREAGWGIVFTPEAVATHLGGASGAGNAKISRHFFDSLDCYERKHHGLAGLVALRAAMTIGCSIRACMWCAVLVAMPQKREEALAKTRLHSWLVWRQTTHWRLGPR